MKTKLVRGALACVLLFALAAQAAAITWTPKEFECPVCKTKNVFLVWMSYGSYVYQYESKFQLVFWPYTDSPSVYSCKKCHLSLFLDDFEGTPKEKHAEILKRLEGVKLAPRKQGESATKYYKDAVYLDIPVSERLLVAQRVYEVLGRDEDFWCHFQRVLGYHFEEEQRQAEADGARRKALALAEKMLADEKREGERKELLYVTGAMRHFLKDDRGALKDFRDAQALKYRNKQLDEERQASYDGFLTDLLRQYVEKLGGKGVPKRPAD